MDNKDKLQHPIETSGEWQTFFKREDYIEFSRGVPRMKKDEVLKFAAPIYDSLSGRGLAYMQIYTILLLVEDAFRDKRDRNLL